jgi:hypothetical protein
MDKLSKFATASSKSSQPDYQLPTRDGSEIFKLIKKYTDKIIDEQG